MVWRVRLVRLTDEEIWVEQPVALGCTMTIAPGTRLVAGMTIGQNRWMFSTRVLAIGSIPGERGHRVSAMQLQLPQGVERCRRGSFRVSTVGVTLPSVECWPLLDPSSVVAAEVANRAIITSLERGEAASRGDSGPVVLPEVGPSFRARLLNIGGGGAGMIVDQGEASALERSRLFWMRIDLRPHILAPLGVTARLAHTHMDSTQSTYAGLAFDFTFHAAHRVFVAEQIARYMAAAQASQSMRMAG